MRQGNETTAEAKERERVRRFWLDYHSRRAPKEPTSTANEIGWIAMCCLGLVVLVVVALAFLGR